MRFTCAKDELISGLNIVSRALSTKTTMPILEGILVEAREDGLCLTATNLEIGIEHVLNATVIETGKAVLPGKFFNEVCRRLPDGDVNVTQRENTITILGKNSRTNLQITDADEFPALPEMEGDYVIELEQAILKDMIQQTAYCVAMDESRPILTGALIETKNLEITMVALDGFRLALRRGELLEEAPEMKTVVPGRALNELGRILGEGAISLHVGAQYVCADMGKTQVVMRVLEGEFIHYQQIIPREYQTRIKISRVELEKAVERVSLMAREGLNHPIKFSISDQSLEITSHSEIGDARDELLVYLEGKDLDISFNAKYVGDAIKNLDEDEIWMDFSTALSPSVVRPVEGEGFLALILPVRPMG